MNFNLLFFFPLLHKDLISYASRKSTYIWRIIYGAILYSFFLFYWSKYVSGKGLASIGQGENILWVIYLLNVIIIFIFLPITSSNSIAPEKEKQTFPLIIISRMHPFFILFEKFLSSVIPVFSLVFISLPLFYLTYLLGGVAEFRIYVVLYTLLLTVLQVSAIGLMFSCYCKNNIQALIATYLFMLFFYMLYLLFDLFSFKVNAYQKIMMFPPGFFSYHSVKTDFSTVFIDTMIIWKSILIFFLMSVYFFIRYQKNTSQNKTSFWEKIKKDLFIASQKIVFVTQPIYWRETEKKRLHLWVYWSIFGLLSLLYLIIISIPKLSGNGKDAAELLYLFATFICSIITIIKASSLFSEEYKSKTWDILLTTTISNKEIFTQKIKSVSRWNNLMILQLIFFLILYAYNYTNIKIFLYHIISIIAVMKSVQWFGIWLGIRFKENKRIIFIAISIIVLSFLIVIPCFLIFPNINSIPHNGLFVVLLIGMIASGYIIKRFSHLHMRTTYIIVLSLSSGICFLIYRKIEYLLHFVLVSCPSVLIVGVLDEKVLGYRRLEQGLFFEICLFCFFYVFFRFISNENINKYIRINDTISKKE